MLGKIIKSLLSAVIDLAEVIFLALAMFAVAHLFIVQIHRVDGDSMLSRFHDKDYLLTEKVSFRFRAPQRSEVIIFKYPKAHEYDYIKRIVGLPGEDIMVANGQVKIFNPEHPEGFVLDEPYLDPKTKTTGKAFLDDDQKYHIPNENYIVMGDNREASSDSREWGLVRRDEIIGRAWLRYWPPQAFAFITKN